MFCGAGSFSHVDEDPWTPSTPKGGSSRRKHNNPYSTRGLDKFSLVLAELGARREKIMASESSQGGAVIRFVYTSQDWVPIVVRPKETSPPPPKKKKSSATAGESPKKSPEISAAAAAATDSSPPSPPGREVKNSSSWNLEGCVSDERWRRPGYYWPMVVVLILVCLVFFGRAFAICCTSMWWYLVPIMKGGGGGGGGGGGERNNSKNNNIKMVKKSMKKKDLGRRLSEKKMGVERAVDAGLGFPSKSCRC